MKKGDRVVCVRDTPAKGCWIMFAGRIGEITEAWNFGEVAVRFDPGQPQYWFLPTELRYVDDSAKR